MMHKATDEKAKPSLIDGSRREPTATETVQYIYGMSVSSIFDGPEYLLELRHFLKFRDLLFFPINHYTYARLLHDICKHLFILRYL